MSVHPFPHGCRKRRGAVHVWGDRVAGYEVSHESESGSSWGGTLHFVGATEAITAAYTMNRDTYGGVCEVLVDAGVVDDANPGVGSIDLPSREDF